MALDILVDATTATVTTGGTTAPAAGTVETWTVTCDSTWPTLLAGQQYRVIDKKDLGNLVATGTGAYELMTVTANVIGTGVSWTVTRGVNGVTYAHSSGWTVVPSPTADGLNGALASASLDYVIWPINGYMFTWPVLSAGDGTTVPANDILYLMPLSIGRDTLIDEIWINVNTAGSAGAVLRPAIYTDDSGLPASLVLDPGTIVTTSTGNIGITGLSTTLPRGRYWVGWVTQGSPTTLATIRAFNTVGNTGGNNALPLVLMFTTAGNPYAGTCFQTASFSGVSGALPATLGAPTWTAQQAVEIWLQAGN